MKRKPARIETFAEFMRRARGKRTKVEIASLLGVSYVYIAFFESGRRYPPPKRLRQICDLFGEPFEKWAQTIDWERETDPNIRPIKEYALLRRWYGAAAPLTFRRPDGLEVRVQPAAGAMERVDEDRDPYRIPVLSLARCGEWTAYTDGDYPPGVADEYVHGDTRDPHAFYVRAEGESMTGAGIDPGDLLLVEPSRTDRVRNGAVVLAVTERGQTVKRFYDAGDRILLQPDGPEGEPLTLPKETRDPPDRIFPVTEIRKRL